MVSESASLARIKGDASQQSPHNSCQRPTGREKNQKKPQKPRLPLASAPPAPIPVVLLQPYLAPLLSALINAPLSPDAQTNCQRGPTCPHSDSPPGDSKLSLINRWRWLSVEGCGVFVLASPVPKCRGKAEIYLFYRVVRLVRSCEHSVDACSLTCTSKSFLKIQGERVKVSNPLGRTPHTNIFASKTQ